ncbi:tellurite resistance TerB family protein [Embleya sp. NPDC127516]|uniref:tellurite resistance TerB family protein n=1 Tax=Embleya sp. NPDC127516 TaxID=3363990 RepID=UPI00380611AB
MPLWDKVEQSVRHMQTQLTAKRRELTSDAFRDASMAMCALVAAADGTIDEAETRKVAQLIAGNEALRQFDKDDLQRRFHAHADRLSTDFRLGKAQVMKDIAKARAKPDEARAVIRIGIVIGGADGRFDPSERTVIREACVALGIARAEFGL